MWEYRIEKIKYEDNVDEMQNFQDTLDKYGKKGWELISTTSKFATNNSYWYFICIFKKPLI